MFQPKLFLFCSFNSFQLEFWSQPNAPEAERYTARRSGTCRTGRKEWESRWWAVGIGEASTTGLRAWLKCLFWLFKPQLCFFFWIFFLGVKKGGGGCIFFCCHFWDVNFCWMLSLSKTLQRCQFRGCSCQLFVSFRRSWWISMTWCHTGEWDVKEVVKNTYHGWWVEKHLSLPSWILIKGSSSSILTTFHHSLGF